MRERPFEYLRRMDTNEAFSEETVKNWYIARAFVLDKLRNVSFAPCANKHLHVDIDGDSPVMLAILRQVALLAHYPNFVEYDQFNNLVCKNRTVITLISDKASDEIVHELEREEYLCNLLKYCKHVVYGTVFNDDSFIDVELDIAHELSKRSDSIYICENDISAFLEGKSPDDVYTIDTRKAVYAGRAYGLGAIIDNLPYEDINSAGRYNRALDAFQYKVLQDRKGLQLITPNWCEDLTAVKSGLSNVFCADSFEFRELAIKHQYPRYDMLSELEKKEAWADNNHALSISEHGRWIVEKLILGFRPLNDQERREYEDLFDKRRVAYISLLKNNPSSPTHIDLCSYKELRRIDPDNMKYDSFLMLAIPLILEKIRKG